MRRNRGKCRDRLCPPPPKKAEKAPRFTKLCPLRQEAGKNAALLRSGKKACCREFLTVSTGFSTAGNLGFRVPIRENGFHNRREKSAKSGLTHLEGDSKINKIGNRDVNRAFGGKYHETAFSLG
jgi:hypothetical protein